MSEVLSALGIVLATIAVLRLALQPYLIRSRGSKRRLRVLESCALGPRQRMHIVECDGERILIGATDGAINVIRELDPVSEPTPVQEANRLAPLLRLRQALGGRLMIPLVTLLLAGPALAAEDPASGLLTALSDIESAAAPERLTNTLEIVLLLTLISIAPSLLLMTTCFTRVVIVLSLLRQAIGIQQLPPNQVIIGLALFVTFFVMAPVGEAIQENSLNPYIEREIDASVAKERALVPIRKFLLDHTRERDLSLFVSLSGEEEVSIEDVPLKVLLPSYMISELRTAFEIGFTVFLPFLVIDLVIASILISMGMIVLPPIVISLPFKLMLFVLLDGWNLVIGTLVRGLAP